MAPRAKKVKEQPKPKVKVNTREQEEHAFVVGIDDYFLSYNGEDWLTRVLFAKRFPKIHEAEAWADKLRDQYPNRHVRVCPVWIAFVVSEEGEE